MSDESDAESSTDPRTQPSKTRKMNWGLFASIALALVTIAVIWGLVLNTMLVHRSGETTSHVLELLDTQQASAQETVDELQAQLRETRATTKAEVDAVRRQTTRTSGRVTKLAENNAKAWQQIARDANGNLNTNSNAWQEIVRDANRGLASASERRLDLVESTIGGLENRRSAVEAAALAPLQRAVRRAERRAAAAESGARAALRRAEQRAAADRRTIETSTRAAWQLAIDGAEERLERARKRYQALAHRWEQPTEAIAAELERARQHIDAAAKDLRAAVAALIDRERGLSRTAALTDRLQRMRLEITRAEDVFDRLSSLVAAR